MPIAFGSRGDRIVRSGFVHGMSCVSIINRSEPGMHLPGISPEIRGVPGKKEEEESLSSCSSSIGRNSDCSIRSSVSDGQDSPGETEVQSSYKGPLDSLDALEESLPIRRGISNFYCGKSKSYASLSEATSPKDLAKPESPYNRKRRNLIASSNIFYDKNRNDPLRYTAGGISKRPANLSRRTLALAVAMNSFESNISEEDRLLSPLNLLSGKSSRGLLSSRSFSLADLQVTGIGSNKKFC